jgi:hypothetical protein
MTRPPNPFPGSNETFSLARWWLHECIHSHEVCPKPRSINTVPRRLIKVNGTTTDPTVKLVSADSPSQAHQPYAALSYCWGGQQRHILRRNVSDGWYFAMPYSQLPQTIKDAIRVTQEIGLQYLWVDALCIYQDDEQDKQEQIACMAEIYEQAFVTISAARARTAEEGFLHSIRESGGFAQMGFKLPFRSLNGELGSITLHNLKPGGIGWHEPLDKRGWTLQETLLSSRILEYGTSQVRWRCHSRDYVDGWTRAKIRSWNPDINWALSTSGVPIDVRKWQYLVSEYSNRDLKEPGDKLLAVSAIARKLGQLSGDYYVAGLWMHSLGEFLLWRCYSNSTTNGQYPHEYRAPSWSWASIDGSIFWEPYGGIQTELSDIRVETIPPHSPYGAIKAASLTLRGQSYGAVVTKRSEILHPDLKRSILGQLWFDTHVENLDRSIWSRKITLFQITIIDARSVGLILHEIGDNQHCRIGLYSLDRLPNMHYTPASRSWMKKTVTLI